MKKKIVGIFVTGLLIGTMLSVVNSVSACTGFTASEDGKVLVGANMDWSHNFNMYMHFFPAEEEKYGRVIIDFKFALVNWEPYPDDPDWIVPKEGMNDQGLFYSVFVAPYLLPENSNDKPIFYSDDPDYYTHELNAYCLAKCSTVSEVLDVYDDYNLVGMHQCQAFFADRNGDSLIIEGDDIVYREGNFQVITNFYQSHPEVGLYPCWRYETAVEMLENMNELSCEYFRSICNATHVDTTVHSNIYDLNQGIFYINYYNNFEKTMEFDLNEELTKGKRRIHIGSLFEPENNQAPLKPNAPTGDETGIPGTDYRYSCKKTSDPDGDRIMYLFDWGDGSDSGWIVPKFGTIKAYHNWSEQGNFEVKVKAMDVYGREGEWSDPLKVTMPRNRLINRPLLNFLENHPIIFRLLQKMIQRLVL